MGYTGKTDCPDKLDLRDMVRRSLENGLTDWTAYVTEASIHINGGKWHSSMGHIDKMDRPYKLDGSNWLAA